ncbi:MAG: hypothetical protein HY532_08875 [Chloroflexi bacterium]|nr:hypothetical protein [Chloroflexota bacterium]
MAEQAYKGDVLQRIAGISFILGAILTTAGNILAPRVDNPGDVAAAIARLSENPNMAKLAFFLIALGIWLMAIGLAGVYRSITTGGASAWVRLGFYSVIGATALMTTSFALLIGAATAAGQGAAGAGSASALIVAVNALFALSSTAYWLALAFVGLGMAMSSVYPKWAGWILLGIGAGIVILYGLPSIFSTPTGTLNLIFAVLAGLTSLWALVIGAWITRREMKAM